MSSWRALWLALAVALCASLRPVQGFGAGRWHLQRPAGCRAIKASDLPHLSASSRISSPVSTPGISMNESMSPCRIKVIGVGGGGGNAVNRMVQSSIGIAGVEMWSINTDAQALSRNLAPHKLIIGNSVSRGLGAGGSPEVGARAAEESRESILDMVKNTDLVFVTAGMGGGTGSGAAPIVAQCARQAGALTVGVVTKPFAFEGRKRSQQARDAIQQLRDSVDTLIVVSNDKLLQIVAEDTPLTDAFLRADDILRQGVVGVSEIIVKPGLVNVDFADVRAIMGNAGTSLMGIGQGRGKARAVDAARMAISSPLLDRPITKARGIVFNVVGGPDMTLQEINSAASVIYENVDEEANIIFGALVDDKITSGEVTITVLATGFATDPHTEDDAAAAFMARSRRRAAAVTAAATEDETTMEATEVAVVDGDVFVEGSRVQSKTDLFAALGRRQRAASGDSLEDDLLDTEEAAPAAGRSKPKARGFGSGLFQKLFG